MQLFQHYTNGVKGNGPKWNQASSLLSRRYSLPKSISHPKLDDILLDAQDETLYVLKPQGLTHSVSVVANAQRSDWRERSCTTSSLPRVPKHLPFQNPDKNWMVVPHYSTEEHGPAQFPAAIAVALDEQLSLSEVSNPSNWRYSSVSPFLSPFSHVAPKPTLFLSLCSSSQRTSRPHAKSISSAEPNGVCSNLSMLQRRKKKKAIVCCDLPLLKKKSATLARVFPFLMRPSWPYPALFLQAWVFSKVVQFLFQNQGRFHYKICSHMLQPNNWTLFLS